MRFGSHSKRSSRPRQLYKVNQPYCMTRTLASGLTYHWGYQLKGPVAQHFSISGRTIRHMHVHMYESAPQENPDADFSFDGQNWYKMHENDSEDLKDLFCNEFYIRVVSDDTAEIGIVFIFAQEFATES